MGDGNPTLTIDQIITNMSIVNLTDDTILIFELADKPHVEEASLQVIQMIRERVGWQGIGIFMQHGMKIDSMGADEALGLYKELKKRFEPEK